MWPFEASFMSMKNLVCPAIRVALIVLTAQLSAAEPDVPKPLPLLDGEPQRGRWIALSGETMPGGAEEYEWQQTAGPVVRFLDEQRTKARVWTILREPGKYAFALRARNPQGWSAPALLEFEVPNSAPAIPLEEAFQPTGAGEEIRLPGEAWKQISGRAITVREMPDRRFTCFRLLQEGLYLFEAWRAGDVPERRGYWVPPGRDDEMGDRRPVAVLPPALSGRVGQPLVLDASPSYDRDGTDEPLVARWEVDTVHGATLAVTGPLKAAFWAPREGVYKLALFVSDGKLDSRPEKRFIQIVDADAPAPAESIVLDQADEGERMRRVQLRLYESTLDDAVQRFPSRCGVALRVDPAFLQSDRFARIRLELGARNASVRMLADWIARQADGWYRVEPNTSFWLTTPTAWVAERQPLESLLPKVDALHEEEDAGDLLRILNQLFDGVLKESVDARLVYRAEQDQILAVMPRKAVDRLKEVLNHLRAPKGLGLLPPADLTPEERSVRHALAQTMVTGTWTARRFDLLLRDLDEQTGMPAAFDPRQFPKGVPKVTLSCNQTPLRQVVRDLVEQAGFDGCQASPLGGLWFYKGAEPCVTRELLWDRAVVRTYDVESILKQLPMVSGEVISHLIRQRVFADSWTVAGTCCRYHKPTSKLVVVHVPEAQDRVVRVLWDLQLRGESALGPALTPDAGP